MSSQANRSEVRKLWRSDPNLKALQDEVKKILLKIQQFSNSLNPNDPLWKFIPLLVKLSRLISRNSLVFTQKIAKGLNKKIDQNQKDVKELQDIIKNLQATIEAAQAMTDLSSGSDSRKRPRTLLKL